VIAYQLRSNLYRDRASTQNNLYHDSKKCAIPSLHRDPPAGGAKVSARQLAGARCLRRVTQPPHIAGPLGAIQRLSGKYS